jgi:hypothetical protein
MRRKQLCLEGVAINVLAHPHRLTGKLALAPSSCREGTFLLGCTHSLISEDNGQPRRLALGDALQEQLCQPLHDFFQ